MIACRLALAALIAPLLLSTALAQTSNGPTRSTPSPVQDPQPQPKAAPAEGCYDIIVKVVGEHPDGGDWDFRPGDRALPDPLITEATTGGEFSCDNTTICSFVIPNAKGTLTFNIVDADIFDADDPVGSASCKVGQSCTAGRATILMSPC